ncbi:LPS assembly lipoprotein LptE [Pseudooceanicola sp. C21-150M6]|uniref:LPS assembly lipoprotein LptE n=1 Tax=Pseudooceanicola sp. C21-150M6 TaxID=3434355 RepID=UPI003D7FDA17
MSSCDRSFDRRSLLRLLATAPMAAGVSACGFTPAYGPGGGASKLTGRVAVSAPTTRETYLMTRQLEERLGRTSAPAYQLSYTLELEEERIAITSDNITRRFNLIGKASYRLTDLTGNELAKGQVESFTGYSATGTTVATRAARWDAEERLATILSDDIVTRLIAVAATLPA